MKDEHEIWQRALSNTCDTKNSITNMSKDVKAAKLQQMTAHNVA